MRRRCYVLAAWITAAVLVAGCGPPSGAVFGTLGPRAEALGYFPAGSTAIVLVRTDPADPGVRALAAALPARTRAQLSAFASENKLFLAQVRSLLGNDLVIGVPRPGAPPLAALVTRDADYLSILAESRVAAGRATRLGGYRGARLYRGRGHAFSVRSTVLLVSRDVEAIREALDRRVSDVVTYDQQRVARQLPAWQGERPVLRAIVDGSAFVARLGARAREVPWLAAWERLGMLVQVHDGAAVASVQLGTGAGELVERDVPVPPGPRAPRALEGDGVSVRDLAHVVGALDAVASSAFPLQRLQAERVFRAVGSGRRGVDLFADVAGRLHGPATLVVGGSAWVLRADASRPRALRPLVERVAARLPAALQPLSGGRRSARWSVERSGPLFTLRRGRRSVLRFGVASGALVAGTASARALLDLAQSRPRRARAARGGLSLSLSGADVRRLLALLDPDAASAWPGWPLHGYLSASSPRRLVGELRAPLR